MSSILGHLRVQSQKLTTFAADEDQKLLLYIDYVCAEQAVTLPWDDIASTMEPRNPSIGEKPMTGEAIKQHLAKLRDHRISEGYDVPPKLDRNARRQAIAGKISLQTPAPTPRKFGVSGGQGKGKVEVEGPAKKESTLLAPISKAKQKKAEQAKKAAGIGNDGGKGPATDGPGVGGKGVTGKRGRRSAIKKDDDPDSGAAAGGSSARQPRHPERKNYAGMAPGPEDSNIKNEPDSENDQPLFKRRNVARKSGASKPAVLGLYNDTVRRWNNRGTKTAADEATAQSAGVERPKDHFITVPNDSDHDQQSDHDLPKVPQTAPIMSNGAEFTFCRNINYQGPGPYGVPDQQGINFGSSWPQQLQSGHPSPMDDTFMPPQTGMYPGPGQTVNLPYGKDSSAMPQTPFTPLACGNANQQVENDLVGPQTPFTPLAFGNMNQQTSGFDAFNSSPTYGSFSSHTLPGTNFDQSFDPALSNSASRNTSFDSSLVSANDLQDPFGGGNIDGSFGGLPAAMPAANPNNWANATISHAPTRFAGLASLDTGFHQPVDIGGQNLPDYVEPSMPGAGLGISVPQASGDAFHPATMSSADHANVKNELPSSHLSQPATPFMASGYDLAHPQDSFGDFAHSLIGHANLSHIPDNDIFG